MKTLPEEINIRFTKEDLKVADRYQSHNKCLMATALTRMGYNHDRDITVVSEGKTTIGGIKYLPRQQFDCSIVGGIDPRESYSYNRSVIGMEITLVKQ